MDDFDFTQTFQDLAEDLDALDALAASAQSRLSDFRVQTQKHPDFFQANSRQTIHQTLAPSLAAHKDIRERLRAAANRKKTWSTAEDCLETIALKKTVYDELRTLQGVSAGIISAMDWQSPSYEHTLASQAGRQTGKIIGTQNDYKRDHHPDATAYEWAFAREYIRTGLHFPVRPYAMSSGMAAFATLAEALRPEVNEKESVLVGNAVYFENKKVLRRIFGDRIRWVPEMNADEILKTVAEVKPRIIFLDTLCNTDSVDMPDLERLIPELSRAVKDTTYLVLDNSALAIACQPLRLLPAFSKLRLVVMESLNKFHQFGFDRVTGGIAWASGLPSNRLFTTRMHFGSNIPNTSVLALPEPNATLLEHRLFRLGRNAQWLAETLQTQIQSLKHTPLSHIAYPGLPSYPGYAWTKNRPFHGAYFVFRFKPEYERVSVYENFLASVISEAKKAGVDLNAGTSFGFDATRVYLTARYAEEDAKPFVRVAVGTESRWEMEKLKQVFVNAINHTLI